MLKHLSLKLSLVSGLIIIVVSYEHIMRLCDSIKIMTQIRGDADIVELLLRSGAECNVMDCGLC